MPRQGHISCQQISAKAFAAKFKSKREIYTFLAAEFDVYLPPYGMCWPVANDDDPFKLKVII